MTNQLSDDQVVAAPSQRGGPRRGTRLFVISDLHLGGDPPMMGRPDQLESFIDALPDSDATSETELVIAGDFVDFLAVAPYADFTPNPVDAEKKLRKVTESPCGVVFDALGRHIARGRRLTVLVGNHDVEMGLPAVQAALLKKIDATPHDVLFVDDGRAYRVGRALIEHGHDHDGANANDWDGLRHLASSQSRARAPVKPFDVSPGSQLVKDVVNELKGTYPFVSLLQPEGELLVLLLLAFEPRLRSDLGMIRQTLHARKLASRAPNRAKRPVSAGGTDKPELDPELKRAFDDVYETLVTPPGGEVSAVAAYLRAWITPGKDSLSVILKEKRPLPPKRLEQLRVTLEKLLSDDHSDRLDGPTQQYGEEAQRLLQSNLGLDAVIMGHTHLPRQREYRGGTYINSGTWIDRIRVPRQALDDTTGEQLAEFLAQLLVAGGVPPIPPTYADLTIDPEGRVTRATLETHPTKLR